MYIIFIITGGAPYIISIATLGGPTSFHQQCLTRWFRLMLARLGRDTRDVERASIVNRLTSDVLVNDNVEVICLEIES